MNDKNSDETAFRLPPTMPKFESPLETRELAEQVAQVTIYLQARVNALENIVLLLVEERARLTQEPWEYMRMFAGHLEKTADNTVKRSPGPTTDLTKDQLDELLQLILERGGTLKNEATRRRD